MCIFVTRAAIVTRAANSIDFEPSSRNICKSEFKFEIKKFYFSSSSSSLAKTIKSSEFEFAPLRVAFSLTLPGKNFFFTNSCSD